MSKRDFFGNRSGEALVRKRKWRGLKFTFFAGGLFFFVIAIAAGAYFLIRSDFFKIKSFEIKGAELSDGNVIKEILVSEMAAAEKWRSFVGSDNIIFWAFGRKPDLKVEATPFLASLNIQTDLAQRKLLVSVKEKELFAVWCLPENNCFSIASDGVVFASAPELQGVLILKFTDENPRTLNFGESVLSSEYWFQNILKTVEAIKENGLSISSARIKSFALEEWEVELYPGLNFYFSLNFVPENFQEVMKNLAKKVELNKLTYLDFRVPNRIYYK